MQTGVDLGSLIWDTGPPPRTSKVTMSLAILALFAIGSLLAMLILPPFIDHPDGLQNGGFWKGLAFVLVFFGAALVLVYTTFYRPTDIGIRFYEQGIEFGTTARTRTAAYERLEFFYFQAFSKTPFDEFLSVAHIVWGVAKLSPSTVANAVEARSTVPPLGEILLKVPSEEEIGILVESGQKSDLLRLLKSVPQRRPGGDWATPIPKGSASR